MKIKVSGIPAEGMDCEADTAEEPWLRHSFQIALDKAFPQGSTGSLHLSIHKTGENVSMVGDLRSHFFPTCDRCLTTFGSHLNLPIKIYLAPACLAKQDPGGDIDFEFYRDDTIDLDSLIAEQLVLSIPIRHLCHNDCKGLCPACGTNLNESRCLCRRTALR